jgi:uncharacterized membrane protein YeaQ/YmgE (transglycosylase-associated protein family)
VPGFPLILWIVVGGIAGWLAGLLAKGRGYGCIGNVVVGIIGSVVGGWLFQVTGIEALPGLLGSLATAVIGAVLLINLLRMLTTRE